APERQAHRRLGPRVRACSGGERDVDLLRDRRRRRTGARAGVVRHSHAGGEAMTTIDVPVIQTEELLSEATYAPPDVNVRLVGSAESVAMAPLGHLLGRL